MFLEMCKQLEFPEEAIAYLDECREKMLSCAGVAGLLSEAMDILFRAESGDAFTEQLQLIADRSGVNRLSVDMVFYVMSAIPLRYLYISRGYTVEQYLENMSDLRYKLMETKQVWGVWGAHTSWFTYFYRLKRFKLGRLQYERKAYDRPDYKDFLKTGDTVYNCHIPSCGPLTPELVYDSLCRAYDFYRDELKDGLLPVVCNTWLLYPPQAERYDKDSNLWHFYQLFDVITSKPKPENPDFWRVFGEKYHPQSAILAPDKTSLQRLILRRLSEGESMGSGYGIIIFDGEKIVN